jgi:hypothetical protein
LLGATIRDNGVPKTTRFELSVAEIKQHTYAADSIGDGALIMSDRLSKFALFVSLVARRKTALRVSATRGEQCEE